MNEKTTFDLTQIVGEQLTAIARTLSAFNARLLVRAHSKREIDELEKVEIFDGVTLKTNANDYTVAELVTILERFTILKCEPVKNGMITTRINATIN